MVSPSSEGVKQIGRDDEIGRFAPCVPLPEITTRACPAGEPAIITEYGPPG
jgi:hypothetical protein